MADERGGDDASDDDPPPGDRVVVRPATEEELAAVMGVLDAAMLDVAYEHVAERVPDEVLVAASDDRILGALVLDGEAVEAVAVRRRRRGQGIGTALVEAAAEGRGTLVAEFDADVRPFYESLGFAVRRVDDGDHDGGVGSDDRRDVRFRGHREQERGSRETHREQERGCWETHQE